MGPGSESFPAISNQQATTRHSIECFGIALFRQQTSLNAPQRVRRGYQCGSESAMERTLRPFPMLVTVVITLLERALTTRRSGEPEVVQRLSVPLLGAIRRARVMLQRSHCMRRRSAQFGPQCGMGPRRDQAKSRRKKQPLHREDLQFLLSLRCIPIHRPLRMASVSRRRGSTKRPRKSHGVPEWPAPKRARSFRNDAIDKKAPGRSYEVGKYSFQVRDGDDVTIEIQCGDAVRINLAGSKKPGIGLVDAVRSSSEGDDSAGMLHIRWFLRPEDLPAWGGMPKNSVEVRGRCPVDPALSDPDCTDSHVLSCSNIHCFDRRMNSCWEQEPIPSGILWRLARAGRTSSSAQVPSRTTRTSVATASAPRKAVGPPCGLCC